jgi:hypothetical protein
MPQLDKYIFFNHVITLTIFFTLIYMFIRKDVVTNISLINKYRKNILLDKICLDVKKLENPLKNIDKLPINSADVPYYHGIYSLEDFQQFNPTIDQSFERSNLRWEFTFVIFSFISPIAVENVFKNYVKKMVNNLYIFSNLTKNALSNQLLTLFLNLTNRGLVFLNSSDLSETSDTEVIALKELIKD